MFGQLMAKVTELADRTPVFPDESVALPPPVPVGDSRAPHKPAPGGPPSAFMAYVNTQRGLRAEPLPDDPEAPALDAAAEKLAAMDPVTKAAYLEELRAKGRRDDYRKKIADMTGEPCTMTDEEIDQELGGALYA